MKNIIPQSVSIGSYTVGNHLPAILIAGPCALESESLSMKIAGELSQLCKQYHVPFLFKGSFDKANRQSIDSYRGPGIKKGLEILTLIKENLHVPVVTDVHKEEEVEAVAKVADLIQIPAFLCRQTDLALAAGKSKKPVNIKKGQFVAHEDMFHLLEKPLRAGAPGVLCTERGNSFGYHDLVVDFRGVAKLKECGAPVILDIGHSLQNPGAGISGGERKYAGELIKAGLAVGLAGIFMEVHTNPAKAKSDAATQMPLSEMESYIRMISQCDAFHKSLIEKSK